MLRRDQKTLLRTLFILITLTSRPSERKNASLHRKRADLQGTTCISGATGSIRFRRFVRPFPVGRSTNVGSACVRRSCHSLRATNPLTVGALSISYRVIRSRRRAQCTQNRRHRCRNRCSTAYHFQPRDPRRFLSSGRSDTRPGDTSIPQPAEARHTRPRSSLGRYPSTSCGYQKALRSAARLARSRHVHDENFAVARRGGVT